MTELYFKLVLQKYHEDIGFTGGTNWQYMPPEYQKIIFYPELWTVEEIEDWGRSKVLEGTLNR